MTLLRLAPRLSSGDQTPPDLQRRPRSHDERNTAWKMIALASERWEPQRGRNPYRKAASRAGWAGSRVGQCGCGAGGAGGGDSEPGSAPAIRWCSRSSTSGESCRRDGWKLPRKVGSDVPLFLVGGAVLGQDRGQQVSPLPDIEPTWCVVVVPEIGVSTPQAFRDWDALCAQEGLTAEASADRLKESSRAYASAFRGEIPEGGPGAGSSGVFSMGEDLAGPQEATPRSGLVRTGITSWIENDFERVVFPQHPSLAEIKRLLAARGTPEAACIPALVGVGFGALRVVPDPRRCRSGTRSDRTRVSSAQSAEHGDHTHLAP